MCPSTRLWINKCLKIIHILYSIVSKEEKKSWNTFLFDFEDYKKGEKIIVSSSAPDVNLAKEKNSEKKF